MGCPCGRSGGQRWLCPILPTRMRLRRWFLQYGAAAPRAGVNLEDCVQHGGLGVGWVNVINILDETNNVLPIPLVMSSFSHRATTCK